jgi:hypothetical protein
MVTTTFPWTDVPRGQVIDISKIKNPLDSRRLQGDIPKTLSESVEELEKNPIIAAKLAEIKKTGKKFDPKKIGTVRLQKIGRSTFLGETQRLLIPKHIGNLMGNFQEELLSPVFATVSKDRKSNPTFDSMHGINLVGLFAKNGLWEGVDSKNWEDFKFPFFIIANSDTAFANEAAYHRNGKGQKKWTAFDFHRIKVAGVRQYQSKEKSYVDAEKRQAICEKNEYIPLPAGHSQRNKAGTLDRIDAVYKWKYQSLDFILKTHKAYWHGTKLDSAAFGLYGHLYEYMKSKHIPMTGTAWNEFLDNFHAIIKKCFTDLSTLRKETELAHAKWHAKAYPNLTKHTLGSTNCALAIVLKIYVHLNGSHPVTNDANDFNYNGHDIYNYLDPVDVHEAVKNA